MARVPVSHRTATQREQDRPEQVENYAGGFTFQITPKQQFERFLILGTSGGTYYASERKLTFKAARAAEAFIRGAHREAVDTIVDISASGRAPSNEPALFALALAGAKGIGSEDGEYALSALERVARIPTHLFSFLGYVKELRAEGFSYRSNGVRDAVRDWYHSKDAQRLAYHTLKYQSREGWSHKDVLRRFKIKSEYVHEQHIWDWVMRDDVRCPLEYPADADYMKQIFAFENIKNLEDSFANARKIAWIVNDVNLTREMVPTWALQYKEVWEALLVNMPAMAVVRNLGKITSIGLIDPFVPLNPVCVNKALERIKDPEVLKKARVHPIKLAEAYKTYINDGSVGRGKLTWRHDARVASALQDGFYACFDAMDPIKGATMLCVDVSSSMSFNAAGSSVLTCAEAAAVMAMAIARKCDSWAVLGFSHGLSNLGITDRMTFAEVVEKVQLRNWGATDCALPFMEAQGKGIDIDTFVVLTDNETWFGNLHPHVALARYRAARTLAETKSVVVGMTATEFSIAEPTDPGMLDVVGFDSSIPQLIAEFTS